MSSRDGRTCRGRIPLREFYESLPNRVRRLARTPIKLQLEPAQRGIYLCHLLN
jgi:hypothetical protein